MAVHRQYTPINREDGISTIHKALGVIVLSLFILIPALILTTKSDVSLADLGTLIGWFICILLILSFFVFPVVYLIIATRWLVQGISICERKRKWKLQAMRAQVPIIDRYERRNEYAEDVEQEWDCELEIGTPEFLQPVVNETAIWAKVNRRVYHRYNGKVVANIFYDPLNPLQFIFGVE